MRDEKSIRQDTKDIDVVILCGGKGSRLQEAVSDRPKPMARIDERPFLDILIGFYKDLGLRRFVLCTGHKSECISSYYAERKDDVEIVISKEDEPLGTAGAVKNAEDLIRSRRFIVVNGDSFCPVDIEGFLKFHFEKEALMSIAVVESEDSSDKGSIRMDEFGKIEVFEEKKKTCGKVYVNAGIYLCERDVLSDIPEGRKCSMEYEIFPELTKRGLYGYAVEGDIIDIGTPRRLQKAKNYFLQNR
jgi:NDP-sugar pyrophosphorylase family protein